MVTRPLIESIASITRPRWRNGVGSRQWCKQATRTIISGMGDPSLCRVGLGIHRLHWAQSPCLIAVYYAVVLPHLLFGEGIVIVCGFIGAVISTAVNYFINDYLSKDNISIEQVEFVPETTSFSLSQKDFDDLKKKTRFETYKQF